MLLLPGAPALSKFRLDKCLAALRALDGRVQSLDAAYCHFVDARRALTDAERRVLERLLESDQSPHWIEDQSQL